MDFFGYLILAGVGYLALKAFSGKPALFPGTDPKTGAPLINSNLFPGYRPGVVGPQPGPPRIPATVTASGAMYCPTGTSLYKDTADGKYYCYNLADLAGAANLFNQPSPQPQPTFTGQAPGPTLDQLGVAAASAPDYQIAQPDLVNLGSSLDTPAPAPVAVPDVVQGDASAPVVDTVSLGSGLSV